MSSSRLPPAPSHVGTYESTTTPRYTFFDLYFVGPTVCVNIYIALLTRDATATTIFTSMQLHEAHVCDA